MSEAELRAALHARIEAMSESHLALVERVLLTLEAEELGAQLKADFAADCCAGSITAERVQDMVASMRVARPYQ